MQGGIVEIHVNNVNAFMQQVSIWRIVWELNNVEENKHE